MGNWWSGAGDNVVTGGRPENWTVSDGGSVSWSRLKEIGLRKKAVRCGETTRTPHERRGEYSRQREYQDATYTMYHFHTTNVRTQENNLLQLKTWPRNAQKVSNATAGPGHVYVICRN